MTTPDTNPQDMALQREAALGKLKQALDMSGALSSSIMANLPELIIEDGHENTEVTPENAVEYS